MDETRREILKLGGLAAFGLAGSALADGKSSAATRFNKDEENAKKGKFIHAFYFKFKKSVSIS